jgi:hypothetical protein
VTTPVLYLYIIKKQELEEKLPKEEKNVVKNILQEEPRPLGGSPPILSIKGLHTEDGRASGLNKSLYNSAGNRRGEK